MTEGTVSARHVFIELLDMDGIVLQWTSELRHDAKYAKVSRGFMSIEKLTQSTHAHLLSFAVLYCLTGLIFAFTSYPALIRGIVAPLVLVAQLIDIACWWLARIQPNRLVWKVEEPASQRATETSWRGAHAGFGRCAYALQCGRTRYLRIWNRAGSDSRRRGSG